MDVFSMAAIGTSSRLAKVTNSVVIDLANAGMDPTGTYDVSYIIQRHLDRALRDYPSIGDNPNSNTYTSVELVMPLGRYLIANTIVVDCSLVNNNYTSDMMSCGIRGSGGGPAGVVLTLAPSCSTMFDFKYGVIFLEKMKFFGHTTGLFAKFGRPQRDPDNPNHGGDVVIKQSTFRDCEWQKWNKVCEVGHMFDAALYNCGFFLHVGQNPVSFNILPHAQDPSNNIMFYRCHWEQAPGGTMIKIAGGEAGGLRHNNIGFFGCHIETRNWDTILMDLENVNRVSLYNTQFTQNNELGVSRGITEAQMAPMFRLKNVSSFHIYNSPIARMNVSTPGNIANKMFDLGGVCSDIRIVGGIMEPWAGTSLFRLWQSNAAVPYVPNGDPPLILDRVVADPTHPLLTPDRMNVSNVTNRNNKWGWRHTDTDELEFGFSSTADKNFSYTTPALSINKDGVFTPRQYSGLKQTIPNNGTATFKFPTTASATQRGVFLVYTDINQDAFAMFFSHGAGVFPMNVGAAANLSAAESSVASKINIYLDASGSIVVKNLIGSSRQIVVVQFGF